MNDKSFDEFEAILDKGYQVYFNYLDNRFLVFSQCLFLCTICTKTSCVI